MCPICGSENIAIERRPNGNCICQSCHHIWANGPVEPALREVNVVFHEVPVSVMNLTPGDTIIVKLKGDDFSEADMHSLQSAMKNRFPDNRIVMFYIPGNSDIDLSVIKTV